VHLTAREQLLREGLAEALVEHSALLMARLKPWIWKQQVKASDLVRLKDSIQIHIQVYIAEVEVSEILSNGFPSIDLDELLTNLQTHHRSLRSLTRQLKRELGVCTPEFNLQRRCLRQPLRTRVGLGASRLKIEPERIYMLPY
jgi:hypothetical protein